jgi:multidrug efflux pump subunit AcrA (membrane-fusion protein)
MKSVSIKILMIITALLLLSACGRGYPVGPGDDSELEHAIAEGLILPFNPNLLEVETRSVTVTRRTLTFTHNRNPVPIFLTSRNLHFDSADRTLAAIHVERGQRVKAGDVLAELAPLNPEESERIFLRRRNAQIALERFDRDFAAERTRRLNELERAGEALEFASDNEWTRLALELERMEIRYSQFLLTNEQNRERLTRQLNDINEQIAGDQIIAPIDGVVVVIHSASPGSTIFGRPRIIWLICEDSLFFVFPLPSSDLLLTRTELQKVFRFNDILNMGMVIQNEEPFTFDVRVVSDPLATDNRSDNRNNMSYLFEPLDWDALFDAFEKHGVDLAGNREPMFTITAVSQAVNVLAVPANTIGTVGDRSYVYIYEHGFSRRQYVQLGARCNESREGFREILSGLEEGQQIVVLR